MRGTRERSAGRPAPKPWVQVAAAPPSPDEPAVRPRRVFVQVIAGAIVVLVAVALVGVVAARRLAEAEAVNDAAKVGGPARRDVVQPALTDGLLNGSRPLAQMDKAVREHVLGPRVSSG